MNKADKFTPSDMIKLSTYLLSASGDRQPLMLPPHLPQPKIKSPNAESFTTNLGWSFSDLPKTAPNKAHTAKIPLDAAMGKNIPVGAAASKHRGAKLLLSTLGLAGAGYLGNRYGRKKEQDLIKDDNYGF